MGILDSIKSKIEEKRELREIENKAYLEHKVECDKIKHKEKVENAKERGRLRAEGKKSNSPFLEKLAEMSDNYNKNLANNDKPLMKLGYDEEKDGKLEDIFRIV